MESVKLAIVGSRSFTNYDLLCKEVAAFCPDKIHKIVSGGAMGADKLGERYAEMEGIPIELFLPDWKKNKKKAGILRNVDIVKACTHVIAFWNGKSPGTKHTIQEARKRGKEVKVIYFE